MAKTIDLKNLHNTVISKIDIYTDPYGEGKEEFVRTLTRMIRRIECLSSFQGESKDDAIRHFISDINDLLEAAHTAGREMEQFDMNDY